MVLGELVPKAMAYDNAERFALGVARPMFLFLKLSRYPVRLLDTLANGVLRSLHRHPGRIHGPLPHGRRSETDRVRDSQARAA